MHGGNRHLDAMAASQGDGARLREGIRWPAPQQMAGGRPGKAQATGTQVQVIRTHDGEGQ